MLHIVFLKSDSQSRPSEKTWFPDCSFVSTHPLVSQVPSPVPEPALTLGFAEASDSLDFEDSLSFLGFCLYMGWETAEIQTSHRYLDLCENAFYAIQLVSIHTGFQPKQGISGLRFRF